MLLQWGLEEGKDLDFTEGLGFEFKERDLPTFCNYHHHYHHLKWPLLNFDGCFGFIEKRGFLYQQPDKGMLGASSEGRCGCYTRLQVELLNSGFGLRP